MKQKTLGFLEAHQSDQPSTFTEDAKWRQENEVAEIERKLGISCMEAAMA